MNPTLAKALDDLQRASVAAALAALVNAHPTDSAVLADIQILLASTKNGAVTQATLDNHEARGALQRALARLVTELRGYTSKLPPVAEAIAAEAKHHEERTAALEANRLAGYRKAYTKTASRYAITPSMQARAQAELAGKEHVPTRRWSEATRAKHRARKAAAAATHVTVPRVVLIHTDAGAAMGSPSTAQHV